MQYIKSHAKKDTLYKFRRATRIRAAKPEILSAEEHILTPPTVWQPVTEVGVPWVYDPVWVAPLAVRAAVAAVEVIAFLNKSAGEVVVAPDLMLTV